ncbi:hypothetical protein [Vibrio furnissii]|uniref:hypothetical protein n=1 Tax=Vibrio furnissii TaxID=29494 RepID=UPI001EEB8966|nr:hypothetical protein [Vibrio furnissii]MCG6268578.1 hypothetical protein [Vibrio furnissii]
MKNKYYEPPKENTFYFKRGFSVVIPASQAYLESMEEFIELNGKRVNKADVDWNKPENASRLYELTNHHTLYSKFGERYNKIVVKSWNDFMNSEVFYDEKPSGKIKDLETFEITDIAHSINSICPNGFEMYPLQIGINEKQIVDIKILDHFCFGDTLYVLNHDDNKIYNKNEFIDYIKELSVDYPYVADKYRNMTLHKMINIDSDYKLFKINYMDSVFFEDEFYIHNTTGLVITKEKKMIDQCVIGDKTLSEVVLKDYRESLKNKVNSDIVKSVFDKYENSTNNRRKKGNRHANNI